MAEKQGQEEERGGGQGGLWEGLEKGCGAEKRLSWGKTWV